MVGLETLLLSLCLVEQGALIDAGPHRLSTGPAVLGLLGERPQCTCRSDPV